MVGDRVFVQPGEERAPLHLPGLRGAIVLIEGTNAQVQFGEQREWVDVAFLRVDRRRERRAVSWQIEDDGPDAGTLLLNA